ncbi:MAG: transglycosylase SLT domain-containing protein [Methylophilaceae bacterium]
MHRKTQVLLAANNWRRHAIVIFSALSFIACLFIPFQSLAITNAKGVEITFLLDGVLSDQPIVEGVLSDQSIVEGVLSDQSIAKSTTTQDNLWARIKQGYSIPNISSKHTAKFENFYAKHPEYVARMMARSQKYLFYVVEEVEKRGMPTEIALLPMIESAYNPTAYSRSHAAGIWQFVPATGKYFGLEQNWWSDNRRNITAATKAALDYLQKLHNMFGSWDLALAAYNAGEGTVGRAIARNKHAGLPINYQNLKLPRETTEYVPKLQAVENIVTHPEQYDLHITTIPNQAYFTEIIPPFQIDAKVIAKLAEISDEEFGLLNPSYKRPVIASINNTHKILLPVANVTTFKSNLASYGKPLTNWSVYNAKRGENITSIANKFNIASSEFRKINSLPKSKRLTKPLKLLIPLNANANKINVAQLINQQTHIERLKRKKNKHVKHKIKGGETLSAIARKYGTSIKALMKINRLKSSRIKIDQIIKVNIKRSKTKTRTKII